MPINAEDYELENEPEYPTRNPIRVAAGKKAAAQFTHEELSERARQAANTRAMRDTQSHSGSRPPYSKAAVKRHQQRQQQGGEDDDEDDDEEEEDAEEEDDKQKRPATKNSRHSSGSAASKFNPHNTRSHDDDDHPVLRSQEKKKDSTGKADDWHRYELENEPEYPTRNPIRVAAGKKAAAQFTHEELSERARQAANTRAMRDTQSHSGSRPPYSKAAVKRHQQRQQQGEDDDEEEEDAEEEVSSNQRGNKRARRGARDD